MEGISPPTITLAFADFEEIHPLSSLALIRLVVPNGRNHWMLRLQFPAILSECLYAFRLHRYAQQVLRLSRNLGTRSPRLFAAYQS